MKEWARHKYVIWKNLNTFQDIRFNIDILYDCLQIIAPLDMLEEGFLYVKNLFQHVFIRNESQAVKRVNMT